MTDIPPDEFIRAANTELERDGYHNVRRDQDGDVEMIDDTGRHLITLTVPIRLDNLVSISTMTAQLWQEAFNAGEREALKQTRAQLETLKAHHGEQLTAQHIEATIKEREDWYAVLDQKEAEEAEALEG